MDVKLIKGNDWEGLYVNGILEEEGHTLNEGEERVVYFLMLSDDIGFNLYDIKFYSATEEDEDYLYRRGRFPNKLEDLSGDYNE
ncbi:MAG: hypothetical protein ACOCZ5_01850 [bacterium]